MVAKCMSKKVAKILLSIGSCVFVVSVVILLMFPTIYKNKLKKDIALGESTLVTKIWKDIPLPLYEKLYCFNITNADDFVNKGASLNVTEVGPYTFKASWVKNYTKWNSNNTVSYTELRTYQFVPEMSVGSQDDEIYTLNGPLIIASDILKQKNMATRKGASFLFNVLGETVVTKKKVRELAYDGYPDQIIKWAPTIKKDIPYKTGVFSWLWGKNNTNDGLFTVFTGVDDPTLTNIIDKFNGNKSFNFWKGDTCNMINGTSIETGPPLPDNPEYYSFLQTIFCRSMTFDYTGEGKRHGVTTKRFEPNDNIFANGSVNPANSCFDLKEERASGVLDVSPCQFDAPVFLSFPHFHMADPSYQNTINGLNPNSNDHGSYVEVEPTTGLTVDLKIRFQINLDVTHTKGVKQFDHVQEGIFPVLWIGIEISLDDYWANFLLGQLKNPKIIAYSVLGAFIFISLVLIVISLVALQFYSKEEDDDPLLDVKEDHKRNLKRRHLSTDYGAIIGPQNQVDQKSLSTSLQSNRSNQGLDISSEVRVLSADEPSDDEALISSVNSNHT